ncbi:MAG: PBP1A family penicillin-binding protein [Spirochaetia bacterium]|nr:PBP1A family penicillin-binding protein [Spirochaetia bacterium]
MKFLIKKIVRTAARIVQFLYPRKPTVFLHVRALFLLVFFLFITAFFAAYLSVDLDSVKKLKNYTPALPSKLLDRKGNLITTFFHDQRILADFEKLPKCLPNAFIAVEDNHFYTHHGLDLQAILRAFLANLRAGGVKQGGSTITQQLAKVILTDRSRTYLRKIKEAFLSIYLDIYFEKKEILNLYFNQIYFGHGNYGIEAASNFYFDKKASELRLGECAILAGLPSAPNRYSPHKNPRLSMSRMSQVLLKMIDMAYITHEEAAKEFEYMVDYFAAINVAPTETAFGRRIDRAPYFSETIRRILEKEIGQKELYSGGYTIYSSLDLEHQEAAQDVLWASLYEQNQFSSEHFFTRLTEFGKQYSHVTSLASLVFDVPEFKIKRSLSKYEMQIYFHQYLRNNALLLNLGLGGDINLDNFLVEMLSEDFFLNRTQKVQGALVEFDNKTGEITAIVGGLPFDTQNQLNRAIQIKRQPGSTFKPLLYAAAIDQKRITPAMIFPDSPLIFLDSEGGSWIPANYTRSYRGFISVREAMRHSANLVSIGIARQAGINNLIPDLAKLLHITEKEIPTNLSLALGSYEVSPIQMAQAFSVFARGGEDIPYQFIHKITDSENKIVKDYDKLLRKPQRILSNASSSIIKSMLEEIVDRGTGTRVRAEGFEDYAAGKTGTTDNFRDAWFVGFNKRYTTAVWVGYDRASLSLGPGQAGGVVAAPIWAKYQKKILKQLKEDEPYLIENEEALEVQICPVSGKQPGLRCTELITELFIPGTEPNELCEESHGVQMNMVEIEGDEIIIEKDPTLAHEDFIGQDDLY